MLILGRGGAVGAKFRISLALPVGAIINCGDNTGNNICWVGVLGTLTMLGRCTSSIHAG